MKSEGATGNMGNTNQPKASTDQATKVIPGPCRNATAGNKTQNGGINRSTQGKA